MDKKVELVANALSELKHQIILNERDWRAVTKKYDLLFLGEKFNIISSIELVHTLNNYFKININNEELNLVLPVVCKALNITIAPMKKVEDINNPKPYCYSITLFD